MERITNDKRDVAEERLCDSEIKRRIYEKFVRRMEKLQSEQTAQFEHCRELNPDVIVIAGDETLLFEPQNLRVTEWLHRHFGMDNLRIRERIQVHPARRQVLTCELKTAGFEVA